MQVIQQSSSSPLQTCGDRLHMPGNLEFISPPFLISAPVIQINSNEISRGKAPFGWGVCSSLQLSPVRRPSSPSEGPNNPPSPSLCGPSLQSRSSSTCGRTNLRRCHSQAQGLERVRLSRLEEMLRLKKKKTKTFASHFFCRGNHRGRDKTETSFDKWTNSGGILFYSQHVCGGL